MEKENEQRGISLFLGFLNRIKEDHVGAYSSEAAYFLIMSFIPFILFLTTLVRYTPLTYRIVRDAIISVVPSNLQGFVLGVVAQIYGMNGAILPISMLTTLWSAGKGMQALINGLNVIYHVKETRSWLINRIYSIIWTVLFVAALVGCLLMLVLGNQIQILASRYIPILGIIIRRILDQRTLIVLFILFLVFDLLYKVLPNRKATFKSQVPGAAFTAVAWILLSDFISIYFRIFPNFANMYGSLAMIILVMLWLYFCMILMMCGAEMNAYFEKEFRKARNTMGDFIHHNKEKIESERQKKSLEKNEKEKSPRIHS